MKFAALTAVTLLAFGLAGCGGDTELYKSLDYSDGWNVYTDIPYKNGKIDCIVKDSDTAYSHTVRSISCDFEEFHRRYG